MLSAYINITLRGVEMGIFMKWDKSIVPVGKLPLRFLFVIGFAVGFLIVYWGKGTFLKNMVLLDVRTPGDYAEFRIPGAVNIPLDELRSRLGELEREKHYVVICAVGVRAYLAARILSNNAFPQVSIYPGGMTYYRAIQ